MSGVGWGVAGTPLSDRGGAKKASTDGCNEPLVWLRRALTAALNSMLGSGVAGLAFLVVDGMFRSRKDVFLTCLYVKHRVFLIQKTTGINQLKASNYKITTLKLNLKPKHFCNYLKFALSLNGSMKHFHKNKGKRRFYCFLM